MLKAVLFDLDGTVLDTLPDLNACMNAALAQFSCPPVTMEQTRRFVGNGGLRFAELSLPAEKRGQAEHFYRDVYCPIHVHCKNEHTMPFAGEAECLAALKAAGMKLAVVTNKSQAAADVLGKTKLAPFGFDAIVGNRDGVPVKPDPTSTLALLRELGVSPAEAAVVGDGDTDVKTAKNAGTRSVSVLWGYRTREELTAAGAEAFASDFAQLQKMLLNM